MTGMVRRRAGVAVLAVLLAAVFLAGPVEAADRVAERGRGGRAWSEVWQRMLSFLGVELETEVGTGPGTGTVEEILPRKGAGIDPNGARLNEYLEPLPTKKGAGIDPNG